MCKHKFPQGDCYLMSTTKHSAWKNAGVFFLSVSSWKNLNIPIPHLKLIKY